MIISSVFLVGLLPLSYSSELTEITVSLIGESQFDLDSSSKFVRADVSVTEWDASDGYYYMKIINLPTGKVVSFKEIIPSQKSGGLYGASVGYMLTNDDPIGEYEIEITTEFGTATSKTTFTVFNSDNPPPTPPPEPVEDPEPTPPVLNTIGDKTVEEGTEISFTVKTTDSGTSETVRTYGFSGTIPDGATIDPVSGIFSWTPTLSQGPGSYQVTIEVSDDLGTDNETFNITVNGVVENVSKVPEWIRNIFIWYGESNISEDDLLNAIKFLVQNNIIKLD